MFFCGRQLGFILRYCLTLQIKFLPQHDQLGRKRTDIVVNILDASRRQTEPALRKLRLFAKRSDRRIGSTHFFSGCLPVCLGKPQGIITAANSRLGFTHSGLCAVQLGLLGGYGISGILCRSAQRVLLPGKGIDLFSRYPVFLLRSFHVGFRHNGRGVGFAQLILVPLIQRSRLTDGIAQRGLPLTGIVQSLGVIGLTVITFGQFGGGLFQRTLVLCHHILLQLQLSFQRGQTGSEPFSACIETLHTGSSQLEIGFRFLYLLIDRLDVSGEVFGIQGQRHNEVAEGFSHGCSLPSAYVAKIPYYLGLNLTVNSGTIKTKGADIMTNIVPISDLKNYTEVLSHCDNGSTVYLTKNGRGKYVVQSLAEHEKLQATVKLLAELSKGVESIRAEGVLSIDEAFSGLED